MGEELAGQGDLALDKIRLDQGAADGVVRDVVAAQADALLDPADGEVGIGELDKQSFTR